MTPDEITRLLVAVVVALFGGGGIWAGVTALSNRRIGIKTTENDANKTINTTWEAIVDDLQGQIVAGRADTDNQLSVLRNQLAKLEERLQKQDAELLFERRLVLKAVGHITRLEVLIPPELVPPRPQGLE